MSPPPEDDATVHPGYVAVHLSAHGGGGPFLEYQKPKRMSGALVASVGAHVAGALVLLLLSRITPEFAPQSTLPERAPSDIVWLVQPGPGGGGGGGGNKTPEPPRKMELPGRDRIAVPAVKPAAPAPAEREPEVEPDPVPEIIIPAKSMAAGVTTAVGAIEATSASNATSQGSGTGDGAGTGSGTGSGSGQGSGLGDGFGGGTGGGAYRPGNGVSAPRLLKQVDPIYTPEAMRARAQGVVVLECIVMPDGTVGETRVKRSLPFGLDEEAIKAARQWRFAPGMRQGVPVPVIIAIEMSFAQR